MKTLLASGNGGNGLITTIFTPSKPELLGFKRRRPIAFARDDLQARAVRTSTRMVW